mgnify:CR=1 FL=1
MNICIGNIRTIERSAGETGKQSATKKGKEWELYDVVKDRTERNNLAEQHPEVLTKLVAEWEKWANANFVLPKHPKK